MSTALPKEVESKYVVLEKMGEGGMGAVYKVRHRFFDEVQVLKFMQAQFQQNEELKSRFLQEARTAKKVRHRNIAEVIDYSVTADGTAYIVMEFVDGVNLRDILKRTGGPLDSALVVEIGFQTLAALGELHRNGFVHRDISPDNLILSRDPNGQPLIKLIDLGIAKSVEHQTQDLTKTGRFMGKMQYASPEQFGGVDGEARVDQRSDLYSFGAVLYELLTGSRLVASSDYRAIIAAALYRPPRPFEETDPHGRVPVPLREVVLKALAKEASDRYQNADEFADALRRATGQHITQPVEMLPTQTEEAAWVFAQSKNSVTAWERFLEAYPDSPRAAQARQKLEEIESQEEGDWEKASATDNAEGWADYLSRHGDSPRASRARRRLERLGEDVERAAWEAIASAPSLESYEKFLASYPRSKRASEVRSALNKMREEAAEEHDWGAAASVDKTGAWRDFLRKHPRSSRVDVARAKLDAAQKRDAEEADWKRAQESQNSATWKEFLQLHPNSSRTGEARKHLAAATQEEIDSADWETAKRIDNAEGWQTYLDRHPQSRRVTAAKKHLASAQEREEVSMRELGARHEREAEERAWKEALEADTPDAFEDFLAERPQSKYAAEARKRLETAATDRVLSDVWRQTTELDTLDAYEAFARDHGGSSHAVEARSRSAKLREREQKDWDQAQAHGTVDAWRDYLQNHPNSTRSNEAQRNVEAAATRVREEADFSLSISRGDVASLRRFLDDHPKSDRVDDVRKRIAVLERRNTPTVEVSMLDAQTRADEEVDDNEELPETVFVRPGDPMPEMPAPKPKTGPKPVPVPTPAPEPPPPAVPPPPPAKSSAPPPAAKAAPAAPAPAPVPPPAPAPVAPVVEARPRPEAGSAKPSGMPKIIIAVAVVIALIVGGVIFMKSAKTPAPGPETPSGPTDTVKPAVPQGQLIVDASPWAEVRHITDEKKKDYMEGVATTYTPYAVSLPPGSYKIELFNPNSKKTAQGTAIVRVNETARCCDVELDPIKADEYLKKALGGKR